MQMCEYFGVPLAGEKTVFPTTEIEFLGIKINSITMEFLLPENKIARSIHLIQVLLDSKKTTLRQLQSLLGLLVFTSRVIPMGRVFCKRLYKATCGKKSPFDHIRVTKPMRSDLQIWLQFLKNFNGRSIWQDDFVSTESINLFTDAAGSIGFGAYFLGQWSAESWPDLWVQSGLVKNIQLLELFPVLVALVIWGNSLRNKRLLIHSDNKGVVFALNCLSAKSPPVVTILRQIVLRCLELNVWLKAAFLPGVSNSLADALSRQQWDKFRSLAPEAELFPTPCPSHLWDLIVT